MKTSKINAFTIFITGILLSCFITSPFILDFTLTPRFISLAVTMLIVLLFMFRHNDNIEIKTDAVLLFYFFYTAFSVLSILWAKNKSEALFESSKQCLAFMVFLFTYYFLKRDKEELLNVLTKFSIAIVFIGLGFAIYQFIEIKKVDKDFVYRITGINGHKNLYASFLFLNLFFLVRGCFTTTKIFKLLSLLAIIISLLTLLFLHTKAVFLGLAIVVCIGFVIFIYTKIKFLDNVKLNIVISIGVCLIIANAFFLLALKPIISKGVNYNSEIISDKVQNKVELDNERLVLWQKSVEIFKKYPIIGVGAGNWQIYFPDATLTGLWRAEDLNYTFQRPHNDFLWILSEYGLIGFNLFLVFLGLIMFTLIRALKIVRVQKTYFEIMLCVAFIFGYFTISFFDFPKERIEHLIYINIIFGFSYYYTKGYTPLKKALSFTLNKMVFGIGILLLIVISTVGILRYRGEFYTRKMYDAKLNAIYAEVIKFGAKAQTFAYTIDPTSVPITWYIGNAHASLKQYKDALNDFEIAYLLNPYNRNVVNDLASAYFMENDIEKAKKLYIETSRISPRFDDSKLNLTAIYIQEKENEKAVKCLNSLCHDSKRRTEYKKMLDVLLQEKE